MGSGADLEYARLLAEAGESSATAGGKDGASLSRDSDNRFVALGGFAGGSAVPPADTTTPGKVQLATGAEAVSGTDNTKAVTPAALAARTNQYATDSSVVHKTGAETIAGVKTFSSAPVVPDDSFTQAKVVSLATDLSDIRDDITTVQGTVGGKQDIDKVYYNYTTNSWPGRPSNANPVTWMSTKGVVATAPPGSALDGDTWKVTPGQTVLA